MADKEKPPEWNLFERLEEVESLYLEQSYSLDDVSCMVRTALVVAVTGLMEIAPKKKALAQLADEWIEMVGRLKGSEEVKKFLTDLLNLARTG